jgi:hypothetical protein
MKFPVGLVVWIFIACFFNLVWIQLNAAPPRMWDDAEYLAESVSTYHALEQRDLSGFVRAASRPARGAHPPMTKLLPIPMYVMFGPGTSSALYSFTVLIPLFCIYLFLLARLVSGNDRTAVLAVVVTCCFPLTYGLWRHVMAEFGLGVAAVAAQYHLFRCAETGRSSVRHGVLAGAFIGWGLLWKISFPVFVAGPLCYVLVRNIGAWKDPARRSGIVASSVIAVAALVVAGPFYFLRLRALWGFAVYNSFPSASLEQFSLGPVFSPVTVLKYWAAVVNIGTSGYFFLMFAALATLQLLRRKWPLSKSGTRVLVTCGIVPLIVFSFQYLKEPRHLFPAFAIFGIVIAALLQETLAGTTTRMRVAVLTAVLAFPIYQFALLSFAIPWAPSQDIRVGPFVLLFADRESPRIGFLPSYAYPANSTAWPVREIVDLLTKQSDDIPGRAPRARIVGYISFVGGPVLNYESLLHHHRPLAYNQPDDRSLHPAWWDFAVVLSGPIRHHTDFRDPILETLLDEQRLPFTMVGKVTLPQDRQAVLYRAASGAVLSNKLIGENLLTAKDRYGRDLFPARKTEWDLPSGRRSVAVPRRGLPIELRYLYVPDTTRYVSWQVVRNPGGMCRSSDLDYRVTVFDLHSRRGPAHELSRVFRLAANRDWASDSLEVEVFGSDIVTIQLSAVSGTDDGGSCIGWNDLNMVADRTVRGSMPPRNTGSLAGPQIVH